jgi:hypothetical protein
MKTTDEIKMTWRDYAKGFLIMFAVGVFLLGTAYLAGCR